MNVRKLSMRINSSLCIREVTQDRKLVNVLNIRKSFVTCCLLLLMRDVQKIMPMNLMKVEKIVLSNPFSLNTELLIPSARRQNSVQFREDTQWTV
jgi:hypothetical protein